ncbi:FCD domain-containing protein [Actinomadura sp. LD22]|uniref:FCD domain-containing protein n=1 Tax=Actinomadura physcomitrii TaxID=2650748 RepID=A0A6I4M8B8_9ACTN|nr:FadR/GntR family transcriptional regulator [Actinomadura physcomitrii]MWA02388.1 FCD domain-containing protein [Actinomadura physcomitrii]MWA03040.1 FCD domain-containing protein [Actinomadura physcomitrii]
MRRGPELRPKKMADLVADRIRKQIVRGELRDGDWLPTEPELIERFGVSRPTLREAFRLLEADSLVRVRRGPPGGARVSVPGPEAAAPIFSLLLALQETTVEDVYAARMVIEPPAARLLAEEGSDAGHDALAAELEKVEAAVGGPFGAATVRFHKRIVELSGNRTLSTMVTLLGEIMSRQIAAAYDETPRQGAALQEGNRLALRSYKRLVELVRRRDGAGAERHWAAHMRRAQEHLFEDPGAGRRQIIDILD